MAEKKDNTPTLESDLDDEDRKKIMKRFLVGVTSSKKRGKIIRLANVLSDGDDESDEFYAALSFYSQPENDRLMHIDFMKYAFGGTTGIEDSEFSQVSSRPPKPKKKAQPKRKRRGKRSR